MFFASNLPQICLNYASSFSLTMPQVCLDFRFTLDAPTMIFPQQCSNYAPTPPQLCFLSQLCPEICLNYAPNMPRATMYQLCFCPIYASTMPQLCFDRLPTCRASLVSSYYVYLRSQTLKVSAIKILY